MMMGQTVVILQDDLNNPLMTSYEEDCSTRLMNIYIFQNILYIFQNIYVNTYNTLKCPI